MADKDSSPSDNTVVGNPLTRAVPALEILLVGGFVIMMLNATFNWGLFKSYDDRVKTNATAPKPAAPAPQTAAQPNPAPPAAVQPTQTTVQLAQTTTGTHRARCRAGDQGLNFRPQAGFSTPLFAIPCGAIVTVNGNAVDVQNETWSPVIYANRSGWAATRFLEVIR
jgi:hypothetical protein